MSGPPPIHRQAEMAGGDAKQVMVGQKRWLVGPKQVVMSWNMQSIGESPFLMSTVWGLIFLHHS